MRAVRRSRLRLQYSLRAMMVALTATCVVLAIAYHYVEPWLVDRAAAEAIVEAGGSVESVPVGPDFLRAWFGPDVLQRVTVVDLPQPEATAACLAHLPKLTRLQKATLAGAKFTGEHLSALGRLDSLRELTLRGTTVSGARVAQMSIERPNLKITVEALPIFWADLEFEYADGQPFRRDELTARIRCLEGGRVRLEGVVGPAEKPPTKTWGIAFYDRSRNRLSLCMVDLMEASEFPLRDSPPLVSIEGTLRIDDKNHINGRGTLFRLSEAREAPNPSPQMRPVQAKQYRR